MNFDSPLSFGLSVVLPMILEVTFEVLRCLSRCPPRETGDLDVFGRF